MNPSPYDFVILGAGVGGLVSANLLAKKGYKVLLLEAHYHCGGCASFYDHRGFSFDVGATTLSGFAYNGPLKKIEKLLGLKFEGVEPELPMQIHLEDLTLNRYRDNERWIKELSENFPGLDHHSVWTHLSSLNKRSWELMNELRSFPPTGLSDFTKLFNPKLFKGVGLLPSLLKSLENNFSNYYQDKTTFKKVLDEQLMISVQNKVSQVALLTSAMGLCYPEDIVVPTGGFKEFNRVLSESFTSLGGELLMRHQVESFKKSGDQFVISTNKGEFIGKKVISNIPYWTLAHDLDSPFKSDFRKTIQKFEDCWGAMTGYMKVKLKKPQDIPYHQVHLQEGGSLFFSFSTPGDTEKAPEGHQSVSVSTHIRPEKFDSFSRRDDNYKAMKENFKETITKTFSETFKQSGIESFEVTAVGTPLTFERYTGRHRGFVGGVVHHLSRPPILFPRHESKVDGFYVVGDSTFPGQGVVGVTQGALLLCDRF